MSSAFADIQGALEDRLNTLPNNLPIAWENDQYEPVGDIYLRPTLLSSDTIQICLGRQGRDQTIGIFQVDVFVPKNQNRTCIPDDIANHFYRESLQLNTTKIRVTSVSVGALVDDINYVFTPVQISFDATTEAR